MQQLCTLRRNFPKPGAKNWSSAAFPPCNNYQKLQTISYQEHSLTFRSSQCRSCFGLLHLNGSQEAVPPDMPYSDDVKMRHPLKR